MSDLTKSKQNQAEIIAKQTAEFLAKGKTIETYKPSALEIAPHRKKIAPKNTRPERSRKDRPIGLKELYETYAIEWLLDEYGRWANMPPNIHLYYPKKSNYDSMTGGSINIPEIDDNSASIIGDAINELDEIKKEIVVMYYVKRRTLDGISEIFSITRTKTTDKLHQAQSWLDGYLKMYIKQRGF